MATQKSNTKQRKPKPRKCDGNTIAGYTTCGNAKLITIAGKDGDLWGIKKCQNCGGTISWGD